VRGREAVELKEKVVSLETTWYVEEGGGQERWTRGGRAEGESRFVGNDVGEGERGG
jgi:hypothetical protein